MLNLLKKPVNTVTELVHNSNIEPTKKPIAKFSYYLKNLERKKMVEITRAEIKLTSLGELIARLIEVKKSVREK